MAERILGKIESVKFGLGGYQDAMMGLSITFSMKGSGIGTFISGGWIIDRPENAKWTEEDRDTQQLYLVKKVMSILKEAKVDDVYKLKNMPVEIVLVDNTLQSWRILTEVL